MSKRLKYHFRIEPNRLKGYNYADAGAYFVTLTTRNMQPYFGKLTPQKTVVLSLLGHKVIQEWIGLPEKFLDLNLELDIVRVLPNHIHAILIIGKNLHNEGRNPFSFSNKTILKLEQEHIYNDRAYRFGNNIVMDNYSEHPNNSLISLLSTFKDTITEFAVKNNVEFSWGAGFHDHIIRNTDEFLRIRKYIMRNIHKHHYKKFLKNLRGEHIIVNNISFSTLGNRALLTLPKVGFLCSRDIATSTEAACIRWAHEQIRNNTCIVCGNHSKTEKTVFNILLKGNQPLILLLARGITQRLPKIYWDQINADRLLILSSFDGSVERVIKVTSLQRNIDMVSITHKIIIGYIKKDGQLSNLINSNPRFQFHILT